MHSLSINSFEFYKGADNMKKFMLAGLIVLAMGIGVFIVFNTTKSIRNTPPSQENPTNTQGTQVKEKEVKLYYANKKYIVSGDETLSKVIPVTKKINYEKMTLAEAAIRELSKKPEREDLDTEVPGQALLGMEIKESAVIINFSGEKLSGGSLEEMLTIEQVVKTLLDIEGINSVQFYRDGKPTESLMGHMDTSEPFYKTKEIKDSELQLGEIKLGMKKDELIQKFGEPVLKSSKIDNDTVKLAYDDFTVNITNGEVSKIITTSEKYVTPSGVRVGDEKKRVMTIYGEPSSEYRKTLNYKVDGESERLHLKIENGKVSEISINL